VKRVGAMGICMPTMHPNAHGAMKTYVVLKGQRGWTSPCVPGTLSSLPPAGPRAQGWTGKSKSSRCQCLAEVGVHPLAIGQGRPSRLGPAGEGCSDGGVLHLHPRGQARYPEGGRRREDEPQGEGGAFAPNAQGDDEHQGDKDSTPCPSRARTRRQPETLTGRQALGKPQLIRETAVGHRPETTS
jgi:hypothetical protein